MPSLGDIKAAGQPVLAVLNGLRENARRPFRAFVRQAERFADTSRPVRQGVGSFFAFAFLMSSLLYGAFQGGYGSAVMAGAGTLVGLKATDIVISGQKEAKEGDIFTALSMGGVPSLVGFDVDAARERVLDLPWVRSVNIRKHYPGKLVVSVSEKEPFAVWQTEQHLSVVERNGSLISKFGIADLLENRFSDLPLLVGKGAPVYASEILPVAAVYPDFSKRVKAYVRVANRRWDVVLRNGLTIKLPEDRLGAALEDVVLADQRNQLFDRQLASLDMRVSGRLVMRLTTEAAEERAKFVSDRRKAMKKAELET